MRCVAPVKPRRSPPIGRWPSRAQRTLPSTSCTFRPRLPTAWPEGAAKGRRSIERAVDVLATTPSRLFGLTRKGAIEPGRDADLVLFDPSARRTLRARDLHHTSDYTPYEGIEVSGAVRSVFLRGRPIISDGAFVGQRGYGRFVERGPIEA